MWSRTIIGMIGGTFLVMPTYTSTFIISFLLSLFGWLWQSTDNAQRCPTLLCTIKLVLFLLLTQALCVNHVQL